VPELGGRGNPATHPTHELATDVEPEPGAADAAGQIRIAPVELCEDPTQLVAGDSEAVVPDGEANVVGVGLEANLDPGFARGVLDRILEQVVEHLAKLPAVRPGRR
jgi:hypothetical protein